MPLNILHATAVVVGKCEGKVPQNVGGLEGFSPNSISYCPVRVKLWMETML